MFQLSKDNITEYLKSKMPVLDFSRPLIISEIGEGSLEEDGDGYINFVFRVSDGNYKLIIKQGLSHGRNVPFALPAERNQLEYESMRMRKAIVPDYVPEVYFFDKENYIFAMQDVSYLKIVRFQMNQSRLFPKLPFQLAEYLAKSHFYMSEYYLGTSEYRELIAHFMNQGMRTIFDVNAFIVADEDNDHYGGELDPQYVRFSRGLVEDPQVMKERYLLREAYMKHTETFIHGDFHTSNVFADLDELKVIDMEYTFSGPMSYDVGYMMNNFLSQYICAEFRDYDSIEEKRHFQDYCLASIKILVDEYFRIMTECWKKDAKPEYRRIDVVREALYDQWFKEIIGFAANANLGRVVGNIGFPEYDAIDHPVCRAHATCLSGWIDKALLLNRHSYSSIDDCIEDIKKVREVYLNCI